MSESSRCAGRRCSRYSGSQGSQDCRRSPASNHCRPYDIVHIVSAEDVAGPMEVDKIGIEPTFTGICDITGMVLDSSPDLVAFDEMISPFDFYTIHAVSE